MTAAPEDGQMVRVSLQSLTGFEVKTWMVRTDSHQTARKLAEEANPGWEAFSTVALVDTP